MRKGLIQQLKLLAVLAICAYLSTNNGYATEGSFVIESRKFDVDGNLFNSTETADLDPVVVAVGKNSKIVSALVLDFNSLAEGFEEGDEFQLTTRGKNQGGKVSLNYAMGIDIDVNNGYAKLLYSDNNSEIDGKLIITGVNGSDVTVKIECVVKNSKLTKEVLQVDSGGNISRSIVDKKRIYKPISISGELVFGLRPENSAQVK